ncbi:acyl-CoA N-acyltransferase [Papiliotrema laurentii]|uniref:N-alpha-acetyltransferase 40 n=1 Tax=Papiliotrema laurentii TaxID=5418 RepID=A0AAD9FTE3_PAPLA|nr:acyl-CoA N-acyltransferase [Papiliotrema laurentii]
MASIIAGSSVIYTESSKREELFDPSTRYLLLLQPSTHSSSSDTLAMPGALPSAQDRKGKGKVSVDFDQEDLVGYCSFRFDTEETLGSRDVEVVYCYELQMKPEARGQGLGKVLMDELEEIGRDRGMAKSMLTCMKKNTSALSFYLKQGYQPDEIDPTRMAEEESEEDEDEEWQEVGSDGEPVSRDDEEVDYTILSKNLQLQS